MGLLSKVGKLTSSVLGKAKSGANTLYNTVSPYLPEAIGGVLGLGASSAMSGVNGLLGSYFSKKLFDYQQGKQYDMWKQSQLEGPSVQRAGLEAAGYNPMLAINDGFANPFQGGSASAFPVHSGDVESVLGALSGARSKRLQNENLKKQGELIDAQKEETLSRSRRNNAGAAKDVSSALLQGSAVLKGLFGHSAKAARKVGATAAAAATGAAVANKLSKGASSAVAAKALADTGSKSILKTLPLVSAALLGSGFLSYQSWKRDPMRHRDTDDAKTKEAKDWYMRYRINHGNGLW